MNRAAAISLVLLRLCIGWHFLFEGIQKVHSHYTGETVTSRPFSSAGYFREAPGPAGTAWRWANGDPDAEALARLVPAPLEGEPAADRPFTRMPPGLLRDWKSLAARYAEHYKIDREKADTLIEQLGNEAVRWLEWQPDPILDEVRARFGRLESVDLTLLGEREKAAYQAFTDNTAEQKRAFPSGEVTRRMSMAERVAEYRQKLEDLADISGRKAWRFGKDVEKGRLVAARQEVARLRAGLLDDLNRTQTAALMQALNNMAAGGIADPVGVLAGLVREAGQEADKRQKDVDAATKAKESADDTAARKGAEADEPELAERTRLAAALEDAKKKHAEAKKWAEALGKRLSKAVSVNKDLAPLRPADAAKQAVAPINLKDAHASVTELAGELPDAVKASQKEASALADGELRKSASEQVLRMKNAATPLTEGLAGLEPLPPLPPPKPDRLLWWVDFLTRWGLTVIGACILVGFLTRTACWLAALFLLTTYLAVPAFPWLPAVGPSEGNYLFVNKNVIEMFALCALGCLPTGRWFGADGLLRSMWLWMTGGVDDSKEG